MFTIELCEKFTTSDWIQFWANVFTFISVVFAYINLGQNNKSIENSIRPYIIFYVEYNSENNKYNLILENFGNTAGKLDYIKITPELNWKKTILKSNYNKFTDSKDVLLVPKQKIVSSFWFDKYPDKTFKVKIKYHSLYKKSFNKVKNYYETYTINLDFAQNIISFTSKNR